MGGNRSHPNPFPLTDPRARGDDSLHAALPHPCPRRPRRRTDGGRRTHAAGTVGKVLAQRTDGRVDGVAMPDDLKAAALNRTRRLVMIHNHPDSTPFSVGDMDTLATHPGIAGVAVHGHDGTFWRVAALERGNGVLYPVAMKAKGSTP